MILPAGARTTIAVHCLKFALRHCRNALILLILVGNASGNEKGIINPVTDTAHNPFCVATHFPRTSRGWDVDNILPLLTSLGVSMVRDEISWHRTERVRGVYAIDDVDNAWFQAVTSRGIKVIVVLSYGNKLYENPLNPDAFSRYASFLARTLKGKGVAAYEIWNEPNNFGFRKKYGGSWNGRGNPLWLKKFAELVKKASESIRRVDPDTPIITSAGSLPATHYLIRNFPTSLNDIDGITVHPYSFGNKPEFVPYGSVATRIRDGIAVADPDKTLTSVFRRLRETSEKHLGRALGIWVTEYGYTTYTPRGKIRSLHKSVSETDQARYLVRATILALAQDVKSWCIYDFMDDGIDVKHPERNFGLVRNARLRYEVKPSFIALFRLYHLLGESWNIPFEKKPGPQLPWNMNTNNPPGVYLFPFSRFSSGDTAALWAVNDVERVHLQCKSASQCRPLKVTDILTGRSTTVRPDSKNDSTTQAALVIDSNPTLLTHE